MSSSREQHSRRRGFTLLQILVVVNVLAVLSMVLFGAMNAGRARARHAECDIHMKEVALALDTYRQDHGRMPKTLSELVKDNYISPAILRCGSDPDLKAHAQNASYNSYEPYYVIREPRDSGELPIVVCPFHQQNGTKGEQAYKGGYTKQYTALTATLSAANVSGAVTITRPGTGVLTTPRAGAGDLELRGGDRITTGAGTAKLKFADGSEASIEANSELTVLQSYVEGQQRGPLYTLVRQLSGRVSYYVNPGSRFDVATPTATAGALGTRFNIEIVPVAGGLPDTKLTVTEHVVALSTVDRTIEVTEGEPTVSAKDPKNKQKERKPRKEKKAKKKDSSGSGSSGSGSSGSGDDDDEDDDD